MSRKERRLSKRVEAERFTQYYDFFKKSYNTGIIDFTGTLPIKIIYSPLADSARRCFLRFNNGEYPKEVILETGIQCSEPEELASVIMGKKGWGLWLKEWGSGIGEFLFEESEILDQFYTNDIQIPEKLLTDFRNFWNKIRTDYVTKTSLEFLKDKNYE